jgi:signal transduction histidine kinase
MRSAKPSLLKPPATEKLIFWSVAALLLSQMAWWIGLQVRESKNLQNARIATMRAGRAEAWQMDSAEIVRIVFQRDPGSPSRGAIEARLPVFPALAIRKAAIEARFPYVAVVPRPVEPDDPMLLDQSGFLTLRTEVLGAMERERTQALWRAGGEAGLLITAVLLGMTYIYRKLNDEMDLMLRQRNFIASVTHELKTPIASLRVWIETLFARELGEDRKARIQMLMDGDLRRLTELVGNLLDVARADAGSLEMDPERTELAPYIRTVAEAMDHRLGPGSLGLDLQLGIDIFADIDRKNFRTVLENLLSNACKYASDPRHTTVTLDSDGEKAIITVQDEGHGISPKELPRLFQRFYRVGDEMTRQVPGTGLGLFLCWEMVTLHGGDIKAHSAGPGQGTTFTIRLPLSRR